MGDQIAGRVPAEAVTSPSPLIETRGLAKRYPGVTALKGIDFSAEAEEIHALVGANGAGKSTLMNLLAGATSPSAGEILLAGEPVRFSGPAAALERGIATVYQEFSLVPQLSVSRNVFLGREPRGRFGLVDHGRLIAETRTLLDRLSFGLDPKVEVSRLSVAEQQLVEIAKALSFAARVLILDEPTAVLSLAEQSNLFAIMRKLRADGLLILYVSHQLEEVLAIADRITVLRDGEKVATRPVAGLAMADLVAMMIGAPCALPTRGVAVPADAPEYVATYRTADSTGRLVIRAGEILGLAGLVGAGRTTFARALAGNRRSDAEVELAIDGKPVRLTSPLAAMRAGIAYLTEDRKRDGVFSALDIVANVTAAALPAIAVAGIRRPFQERAIARDILRRLRLVASGLDADISKLSGGNQQKVVFGRALLTNPRLLICDEPTRGVDSAPRARSTTSCANWRAGALPCLLLVGDRRTPDREPPHRRDARPALCRRVPGERGQRSCDIGRSLGRRGGGKANRMTDKGKPESLRPRSGSCTACPRMYRRTSHASRPSLGVPRPRARNCSCCPRQRSAVDGPKWR